MAASEAIRKGNEAARKNMVRIPVENGTIPLDYLRQHIEAWLDSKAN